MTNESPAAILYDNLGHPIGIILDGSIYRLQVEAKLTDGYSILGTNNNPIISQSSFVNKKTLYDISDSVIYIGFSDLGTSSSSASWFIKKTILIDGNPISTEWSNKFAIWDNRLTESYS